MLAMAPVNRGDRLYLITGKLSAAGQRERAHRVAAGENDAAVYAELLVKEGKAVAGQIDPR
jgi:hypothetical protein